MSSPRVPIPYPVPDLIKERFWSNVDMQGVDECWPWRGSDGGQGYGRLSVTGKSFRAHRVSVVIHHGPIPDNLVVDHICRNRICVNPKHLRVVTPRINSLENSESPTAYNVVKTHCPKGHEYTEENTRRQNKPDGASRLCKTCHTETALRSYHKTKLRNHRTGNGPKLTEADVLEIRSSKLGQKDLAVKFGVDPKNIYWIRKRITWKHVP